MSKPKSQTPEMAELREELRNAELALKRERAAFNEFVNSIEVYLLPMSNYKEIIRRIRSSARRKASRNAR